MATPVIDLFAGPGGLNEGFSRLRGPDGTSLFHSAASFEMNGAACNTLRLRSVYRQLSQTGDLAPYYSMARDAVSLESALEDARFAAAWRDADREIHEVELSEATRAATVEDIRRALARSGCSDEDAWVLIGGPPCQAYSLAGRSRRTRDATFQEDKKHFLYREYLAILKALQPPVFVMENVKGLLSSTNAGTQMFDRILSDLSAPDPKSPLRYRIHSLVTAIEPDELTPNDFVIRSEEFGIPQRRHRVILLGIRDDVTPGPFTRLHHRAPTTVSQAIRALPPLRSRISRAPDGLPQWLAVRARAQRRFPIEEFRSAPVDLTPGAPFVPAKTRPGRKGWLESWLQDPALGGVMQHETRRHMEADLVRYWFAARFASDEQRSPTLVDFESEGLLPNHANADAEVRPFEDRFRVQLWGRPSTTIVSHIAKDGHYYIHPDPFQMRSLTLREAARLQTFPDNYLFLGNRTDQLVQVGNAVPPLLAYQIAEVVAEILGQRHVSFG